MKRLSLAAAISVIALIAAGPAAAHGIIVNPPGNDAPSPASGPISKPYAQAHCHSAAPEQATANSGGVVTFVPAGAFPCPPVPNPGGQTTGP